VDRSTAVIWLQGRDPSEPNWQIGGDKLRRQCHGGTHYRRFMEKDVSGFALQLAPYHAMGSVFLLGGVPTAQTGSSIWQAHSLCLIAMQDPLNGGDFRKRYGVGSTRPMFKSTDERKRAFYLYYYPSVSTNAMQSTCRPHMQSCGCANLDTAVLRRSTKDA
jgi:hypothetical protein